jgi:hypothetical protein
MNPISDTDSPTGPEPLTLEQTRQIIDSQRARVDAALVVDERRLYLAWGSAWLIGYLGLWATSGSDALPASARPAAFAVFFLLLVAASVFTAVHISRATRGVQGVSATTGRMYGWSWGVSFAALPVLIYSTDRVGASAATIDLLWITLPALLVGVHYMMAGAMWQDRTGFVLGVWIVLSACLAALTGTPMAYLVMSLAGGGGFLVAAGWLVTRQRASGCVTAL